MEYGDVLMHGFLHKKSDFYSKAHISKNVWQKRWVVLDEDKLFYTRKSGVSHAPGVCANLHSQFNRCS